MELKDFIKKAKKECYASGKEPERVGQKDRYVYKEDGFVYIDEYEGSNIVKGKEVVIKDEKIIWEMSYLGQVVSSSVSSHDIFSFLKEFLKRIPSDRPFRGPERYEKQQFKYINTYTGVVEKFSGIEIIKFNDKLIYELKYSGGLV